jgi:hypothetical protein
MPALRPWLAFGGLLALIAVFALLGFFGTRIAEQRNYHTFKDGLAVGMLRSSVAQLVKDTGAASLARDPNTLLVSLPLGSLGVDRTKKLVVIRFDAAGNVRSWRFEN